MSLTWKYILLCSTLAYAFGQFTCRNNRCQNGGTCERTNFHLFCRCRAEYAGLYCQFRKEETTPLGALPRCPRDVGSECDRLACEVDQDCAMSRICCIGSCGSQICYQPSTNECQWSEWSSCRPFIHDLNCGQVAGEQKRTCIQGWEPAQVRKCDLRLRPCTPCRLNFGPWEPWSPCSASCGTGVQKRGRSVMHPSACTGPASETESRPCRPGPLCNAGRCVDESKLCANQGSQRCQDDEYRGSKRVSVRGRPCQQWDSQIPHEHDFSWVGPHNFCRNPNSNTAPWCYTTDPDIRWDFCFPDCDPTPCRDKQTPSVCADFVAKGYCHPGHGNYYAAITKCCRSCRGNFSMGNPGCANWAKEGGCGSVFMSQNCANTCQNIC